jgi:hypothetical protein
MAAGFLSTLLCFDGKNQPAAAGLNLAGALLCINGYIVVDGCRLGRYKRPQLLFYDEH